MRRVTHATVPEQALAPALIVSERRSPNILFVDRHAEIHPLPPCRQLPSTAMLTKHRSDNVRVSHRGCVTTNAWPRQSSERLAQKLDDSHDESAQRLAKIRQRLGFLCHDLRTFSANTHAAERLNSSVHAHFLGPPYLSPEDALYVQAYDVAILRSPEAAPDSESSLGNELSRSFWRGA